MIKMDNRPLNLAILIFDEVEVLDFCGPYEVFSIAGRRNNLKPFEVYTVAEKSGPVIARNNFSINPSYTLEDCPPPDIILIPGGYGTRKEMNNPVIIDWVKKNYDKVELVLSVCTGSLILAKAGLLDGLTITTHHLVLEQLQELAPNSKIDSTKRFIDNGKIIIAAGVSAGIDMSLYVVGRLMGEEFAKEAAKYIEYDWKKEG